MHLRIAPLFFERCHSSIHNFSWRSDHFFNIALWSHIFIKWILISSRREKTTQETTYLLQIDFCSMTYSTSTAAWCTKLNNDLHDVLWLEVGWGKRGLRIPGKSFVDVIRGTQSSFGHLPKRNSVAHTSSSVSCRFATTTPNTRKYGSWDQRCCCIFEHGPLLQCCVCTRCEQNISQKKKFAFVVYVLLSCDIIQSN